MNINGFVYGCFTVYSATFNNISVISWRSVLLVEETGVSEEFEDTKQVTRIRKSKNRQWPKEKVQKDNNKKHRPVASHRQTLSHNVKNSN